MFINDESNQVARHRYNKGYSQVQNLGHPQQMQGHPQQMQGHPQQMQGHPQQMQGHPQQMQGHPQEYPHHPNYSAMEDEPDYDSYDPDLSDDELYDSTNAPSDDSVWDKIKKFFKSTTGIVTLVVILAIVIALIVWYFNKTRGYKFLYY